MVNWLKTWSRASYRGAKFWVDKDQLGTGRRLVVHEFPKRDDPYVEDMGRSANKITVTAYVASDNVLAEAKALKVACDRGGVATLQLPEERMKAHCESCERAWDKNIQGYIAFNLVFWREGTGAGPFPAPYLQRLAYSAAVALPAAVATLLAAGVKTVDQAGFVRDAAAEDVRGLASEIDAVRSVLPLDPDKAPAIARAVQDLYDEAVSLSTIGTAGDKFAAESFVARSRGDTTPPALADRLGSVVEAMREAAAPNDVVTGFVPMTEPADAVDRIGNTPSRRVQMANAMAISLSLRVIALSQWAVAITEIDYSDRRSAIQARADVAERFDAVLDLLDGPAAYETALALVAVRDAATQYLTRMLTDLAPVLIVATNAPMPSLWWAYRLYGDAERAGDLAARNRTIHASFMPTEIEALAR